MKCWTRPPSGTASQILINQHVILESWDATKRIEQLGARLVVAGRGILTDPKLSEAEAQILSDTPDLFKATKEDFLAATEIVERSLIRRGWVQPMRIRPPTYH